MGVLISILLTASKLICEYFKRSLLLKLGLEVEVSVGSAEIVRSNGLIMNAKEPSMRDLIVVKPGERTSTMPPCPPLAPETDMVEEALSAKEAPDFKVTNPPWLALPELASPLAEITELSASDRLWAATNSMTPLAWRTELAWTNPPWLTTC